MSAVDENAKETTAGGSPPQYHDHSESPVADKEALSTEKVARVGTSEDDVKIDLDSEGDVDITDIFKPLPPLEGVPAEPNPLTVRAVLVGLVLGSLVNASNVYLGECYPDMLVRR
jgi:hypothetical protein